MSCDERLTFQYWAKQDQGTFQTPITINIKVDDLSLPFRSPFQLPSLDDSRYLEISRTGNFEFEYHFSWNLNLLSH